MRVSVTEGHFSSIRTVAKDSATNRAGHITIDSPTLLMDGVSTIEATTLGDRDAATVVVTVDTLRLRGDPDVSSSA